MTTLQKALLGATLTAAIGTGIYEARRSADSREQARALRLQHESLAQQNRLLTEDRDQASNRLAAVRADRSQVQASLLELARLRAEVGTRARSGHPAKSLGADLPCKHLLLIPCVAGTA